MEFPFLLILDLVQTSLEVAFLLFLDILFDCYDI